MKSNSQNSRLIKALKDNPYGLTARQLQQITGSTAIATRVSECRKHGYNIRNYKGNKYNIYRIIEEANNAK